MAEALICKHTGADALYMRDEVGVYEFVIMLAVALETDEQEFFRQYVLTGSDPKKFKWVYKGSSASRQGALDVDKLVMQWTAGDKGGPGNKANIAPPEAVAHLAKKKVFQRTLEYPDGRKVVEYVDEAGNPVEMTGNVFMQSKRQD